MLSFRNSYYSVTKDSEFNPQYELCNFTLFILNLQHFSFLLSHAFTVREFELFMFTTQQKLKKETFKSKYDTNWTR